MVKGVSKSVIVVPSPDPSLFESAIFIMRDDAVPSSGSSRRRILREAARIAGTYVSESVPRRRHSIPAPVWCAAGAVAAGTAAVLIYIFT